MRAILRDVIKITNKHQTNPMKTLIVAAITALCMAGSSLASDFVPGRVLVKPSASANENSMHHSLRAAGAREVGRIPQLDVRILEVPEAAEGSVVAALSNNPNFEYAEPDYIATAVATPDDTFYASYQWHLPKIGAPAAWDVTTGAAAVKIAIVDSGVQANHPDLGGRVLPGYDFVNNDSDAADDNGHGTAVAGTAAATGNNGAGVAGVAWNVAILPVKVLGTDNTGSYSAIASGINYAADQGARIINLSLGGTTSSRTLQSAVSYAWNKGCVLVAAAGNNSSSAAFYPAAYSQALAVSALNSVDVLPAWSNYGSYVDISAPGENITTTTYGGGYITISGTSFASPLVAGAAALALSLDPTLSNSAVVSLLTSSADDLGATGYDIYYGAGRLNAAKVAAGAVRVPDATAPATAVTNPKDGASITGAKSVSVRVASSDNVGVVKAELYINGKLVASSASGAFSYNWSTSKIARGKYTLQSKAYDAAGNSSVSAFVTVTR